MSRESFRLTQARRKVHAHLTASLPAELTAAASEWPDDADLLPTRVISGERTFDLGDDPAQTGDALYVIPQEVRTLDDRLPLVAVSAAASGPYLATEFDGSLSEEYRAVHQMQVYVWTATTRWEDAATAIESLVACVIRALLGDMTMGDRTDCIRIVADSVSVSYSEITSYGGDGALAGAAIAVSVSTEDAVTKTGVGTVDTAEPTAAVVGPGSDL